MSNFDTFLIGIIYFHILHSGLWPIPERALMRKPEGGS